MNKILRGIALVRAYWQFKHSGAVKWRQYAIILGVVAMLGLAFHYCRGVQKAAGGTMPSNLQSSKREDVEAVFQALYREMPLVIGVQRTYLAAGNATGYVRLPYNLGNTNYTAIISMYRDNDTANSVGITTLQPWRASPHTGDSVRVAKDTNDSGFVSTIIVLSGAKGK